ncbi:MAG TPA: tetratricopeptide repeat protein [Gemmatimonadaceae bacterium]|nr:tetratricopeptide repeat protein [Gemmatimonadaceae bacterium]
MTRILVIAVLVTLPLGAGVSEAGAQVSHHADGALGSVDFAVSCSAPAQAEFNRAVGLLHHMTYPRARESFQQVAKLDPSCAMAHWGIAMTLFQPLWPTRPGPDELRLGWAEVQKARALDLRTDRERLFVDAAAAFFEPGTWDYWQRIGRWEEAMRRAYAALPRDPEVTAFRALSLLATAPSDKVTRDHADEAAALLLAMYEQQPEHPGAMHYLVHANDTPGRERESLKIVRAYGTAAPRNPHALHMPTHIYTRLGDWGAVIDGNQAAAEIALAHPAGDRGQFVWDEFPHAIEYLVYAYLQMGEDGEALRQLKRLTGTARLEPTLKTAFHLASTQARYALERRAWGEARALAPRDPSTLDWDRFKWPEAVTWFARGLGSVYEGRVQDAEAARTRLQQLETAAGESGEQLFARNIRVLRLAVDAWLAHAKGEKRGGERLMREAAELEVSTPKHAVTPGPTLPAHELLGDLLLEQDQPAQALTAYERSLELYPRRFNSLLGAARAARAAGDDARARGFYQQLLEVAGNGTRQPALSEARTFVARARRKNAP